MQLLYIHSSKMSTFFQYKTLFYRATYSKKAPFIRRYYTWRKILKEIVLLLSTAIIVSLDSFVAGFSLSLNKKANAVLPVAVALVTLILCALTTVAGTLLADYLDESVDIFGATVLVTLAIINLFKKEDEQLNSLQQITIIESLAMGFAVGTDAAVANLSLAVEGCGLSAPIVFAVTHYFTVFIGQRLAGKVVLERTNYFSAAVLVALAVLKFV